MATVLRFLTRLSRLNLCIGLFAPAIRVLPLATPSVPLVMLQHSPIQRIFSNVALKKSIKQLIVLRLSKSCWTGERFAFVHPFGKNKIGQWNYALLQNRFGLFFF